MTQTEQVKGYYNNNKILTESMTNYDTTTTGVIEYLWDNYSLRVYETGQLNYDTGTGQNSMTNQAIISLQKDPSTYIGKVICIFHDSTVIGSSIISGATQMEAYVMLIMSHQHCLMDGCDYSYNIYDEDQIDTANVVSSTASSITLSGLTSIYVNVVDYYVGYRLTTSSGANSLIISYDPSTFTFVLRESVGIAGVGTLVTITDPSTNAVITLPGIDLIGNEILDYSQSYHNYYVINETRTTGTNIKYSKISSYNYAIRAATLETPFVNWVPSDKYSLRKSLPQEFITSFTPSLSGTLMQDANSNSVVVYFTPVQIQKVTSLNFNYVGLQLIINNASYTIQSVTIVPPPTDPESLTYQTNLLLYGAPFTIVLPDTVSAPTTTPFTINPTFNPVKNPNTNQNYPQISLTNCIFLQNANPTDNYYKGKYIYIYPQETANNQTTQLTNIRGSCYYINAYVGNGYNACFVNLVDTPDVSGASLYYPAYVNRTGQISGTLNIVSFQSTNYKPLLYNGSTVSQTELVAYEISLNSLILPNSTLKNGTNIVNYPFVYVEFTVNNNNPPDLIYSNNSKSKRALFMAAITDIKNKYTTPFLKLYGKSMTQTVKFRPNDCLKFSVFLPDGTLFETIASDYYSPSAPNPFCQIDALFGIQRL